MNTDTPETDSHYYPDFEMGCDVVLADFARKLERERDELKALLTKKHGAVTISRNGYVQELERERDRLAEVMTQILNTSMNHTRRELLLEQALQSLTPKP
jgi:hypothetical protein